MLTKSQKMDLDALRKGPLRPGATSAEYHRIVFSKYFSRPVIVEVPLGELARPDNLGLMIHVKRHGYEIASLTGKEKFNAQGLEGKARLKGYTYYDALIATVTLPDHRFRIVEK